ncbi:uncharacterized protein involved in outer membrane biogenesis [Nitrosomonas sp. Nm84]|uniref:DUF748 domain-containing protein n=1 Tax=Nitrosomonas sp. Nm84 TaxID=200124 RepID=UPI000D75C579|nr:DUF748 domain-containing protein [Nitrosomonas sp. Nm84]PXW88926.1 uncharacterized protein involved in outer membrane biogenesis [Nitrosomonas sp. Nm84]
MTSTVQPRVTRYKRLSISLGIVVALIALLVALSYFWLPGYAKSQLETRLSELLQRPVSVASIEIKLHTLELIIQGFRIDEKADAREESATLFAFGKLHVDLSIESLKHRAPVITSVSLVEPKLHLVREAENQFNISDLLEKFSQPADEKDEDPGDAQFSISNITIQGGHFEFVDRHMKTDHKITEINLGIPVVANFKSTLTNWIEPHFSAKINGSPLSLDGKLRAFTESQEATLTLKLSEFDLTEIDRYAPLPKGIKLLSGLYDSELLVTFVQAPDKAPDITLTGTTTLRQLAVKNSAVEVPYQARLKQLAIALTQVDLTGKKPSQVKLHIDQIALTREGEKEPALSLAQLDIDAITVNTTSRQIALGEITLDRLKTTLRRDTSGTIDLTRLFNSSDEQAEPKPQVQVQTKAKAQPKIQARIPLPARKPAYPATEIKIAEKQTEPTKPREPQRVNKEKPSSPDAPWTTQIKRIKLKAAKLQYEDLTLTKAAPMVVDPLDLAVDNIDLSGVKPLNLALQAQVNQRGKLKVDGSLAWAPLATDLTLNLDSVDVVSLQGWAGDKLAAMLTSGDISFDGKIQANGEPLKIAVNGNGKLGNFNVFDPQSAQDLLRWKKLDISNLNFVNEPLRVDIKTIGLSDFFARVMILPDGNFNLKQIVRQDVPLEPQATAASVAPATTQQPVQAKKDTPVHIDKIILQQGNINFSDQFIKPNYRANLTGLAGQIGPLHPGKQGKIDIRGMVAKTAPLEIRGTTDPFSSELALDLVAKVKNIDLPPFSPYSVKYIGYEIEKGKLSADVNYQIDKGVLSGNNKIFLDQFTLGEKVESEDAVSLPLSLAISILKNRRGEIDIHLPIKGSLDDPQFSLSDIIFTALTNLITKAITSPFALLGSVLEGGEELSEITFTPGFADIDADAAKRLEALAKILNDRPSLNLEISGHVDPAQDLEGLKVAMLQDKVKAQKLAEQTKADIASTDLADVTLTPEEYSKYLEVAYKKETFEKPKNAIGFAKSLPSAEMEQLILTNTQVNDDDLAILAERRANTALNWLIENGKISDERVFVVGAHENKEDEQKNGNRAEFVLK